MRDASTVESTTFFANGSRRRSRAFHDGLGRVFMPSAAPTTAGAEEGKELLFWAWDEPISELMKQGFEAKFPGYVARHEIIA